MDGRMQLTQHTDYGLRLLIVLARHAERAAAGDAAGPVALPEFAASQKLSYHHVAKVAQALAREGFIHSRRGRSGGVALARPAGEITIGQVVRVLERAMQLADCGRCALRGDCSTSGFLAEALAAFLAVLDRITLAEAARQHTPAFAPWAAARDAGEPG
ncbi:MAG: Rrf2 family transcriptional regulator [Novosphingobium sp.]|nr:Rrf2 family transcriptional regulator [Novosphingobium sp.]